MKAITVGQKKSIMAIGGWLGTVI